MARDFHLAVDVHAHQQAESEHHRQHGAAAIGQKRHGNAHHRDQAHHHQPVDHDVEEEVQDDAHGQQAAELAAGAHRGLHAIEDDHREQHQQRQGADKAEFLAEAGPDKVGLFFGQEVQPALGALGEALARHPARADGDLGLGDVPALAQCVQFGMDEGLYPRLLRVMQHKACILYTSPRPRDEA